MNNITMMDLLARCAQKKAEELEELARREYPGTAIVEELWMRAKLLRDHSDVYALAFKAMNG